MIPVSDQKLLIQQLYSSTKRTGTLRLNYLLLSIYEGLLERELAQFASLEEVELCAGQEGEGAKKGGGEDYKELMSTFIFQFIFDSQPTNIDTICCIVCHFINYIQATFQNSQGEEDTTLDVEDAAGSKGGDAGGKGGKKGGKAKGGGAGGGGSQAARATALADFQAKMADAILGNGILAGSAQWFSFKK